jgi:hypothetical protein
MNAPIATVAARTVGDDFIEFPLIGVSKPAFGAKVRQNDDSELHTVIIDTQ